jgi:hypothetical protein
MSDTGYMISLITLMAALGALDVVALRHGADSRRDDGRPNL